MEYDKDICPINSDTCDTATPTYRKISGILYQKLSHQDTFGNAYTYAHQVIDIHAHDQDGFKVLTKLLRKVHPKLNPNCDPIQAPQFCDCPNIHNFIKKYRTYLAFEKLKTKPREYSNKEQLMYVINQLDDRFHEGIVQVKAMMNVYQYQQYPADLLIDEDLVDTIIKHIPDDQHDNLSNNLDDNPIAINKFQRRFQRTSPSTITNSAHVPTSRLERNKTRLLQCSICGGTGHDGIKDGCDLMCKSININNFMSGNKQATQKLIDKMMDKFKERNRNRLQRAKQSLKISKLGLDKELHASIMKVIEDSSENESYLSDASSSSE